MWVYMINFIVVLNVLWDKLKTEEIWHGYFLIIAGKKIVTGTYVNGL